jgi:hypothetical protein
MPVSTAPDFVTLRYKKVVGLGLTFQAINFAQGEFMGHRVRFNVPVDYMNQYFYWVRESGDYRPTGRFLDEGRAATASDISGIPLFSEFLEWALGSEYTDMDGVADALNYSSTALDTYNDSKRDVAEVNYELPEDVSAGVSTAVTHYSANDLVMSYVLFKCFGSSAFDAAEIVYNLEDAFGMLSSKALAEAVRDSLRDEDDLAEAVLIAAAEPKAGQRGKVDEMFRALLAADPARFFKNGTQIPGLFETNYVGDETDPTAEGNWCLKTGDIIEIPIKLFFTAPVTVLSVVDNVNEPSSDSPANPETVFIKGEAGVAGAEWVCTAESMAAANRANVMSVRLQLMCSAPLNDEGNTFATNADVNTPLPSLAVSNKMNIIFYNGPHYPAQSAIAVVPTGGSGALTYSSADLPVGVTLNASTGVLTFDRLAGSISPVSGRHAVTITVADSAITTPATANADIFISIDDGMGSSNNALPTVPA